MADEGGGHRLAQAARSLVPSTRKYSFQHFTVFTLTFFCYAFFHASRKVYPNTKSIIQEEWTPAHRIIGNKSHESWKRLSVKSVAQWDSRHMCEGKDDTEDFLGYLDTAFLFSYAFGLFFSGLIGDRFNPRYVLSTGMILTAAIVFTWGSLLQYFHYYNKYVYLVLWCLNGLIQSSGWPTVVAVMGNWFGKSSRGFVLGLWSACASVGNIIGAEMVNAVEDYGYDYAFLLSAGVLLGGGIVIFFGLVPKPTDVGLPEPEDLEDDEHETDQRGIENANGPDEARDTDRLLGGASSPDGSSSSSIQTRRRPSIPPTHSKVYGTVEEDLEHPPAVETKRPKPIGFVKALTLPGVIPYSLAYAALKLVNYSFFFWLPFYLHDAYRWSADKSNNISQWYDVGGIIGGTIAGFISDKLRKRSPVLFVLLFLSIPSLWIYQASGENYTINAVLMGIVGFFIGGAANIISAAICADMGRLDELRGNAEALATVTGIVDGTGSVGAAIGQMILPEVENHYDWKFVFYFFMFCIFVTLKFIFYMMTREIECLRRFCGRCCSCCTKNAATVRPPSGANSPPLEAYYGDANT